MLEKINISHIKTLLISVLFVLPTTAFAGGCEDENQRWMPVPDEQSCAARNGTWFTCMRDGVDSPFEEDRHMCEREGGVWSVGNAVVEIYAPIPKVQSNFVEFNSKSYFVGNDGIKGSELWVTDGTEAGTKLLKDITLDGSSNIDNLAVKGNKLYFTVGDQYNDQRLWVSDGTTEGTLLLVDVQTRISSSDNLGYFAGEIYFGATGGLWQTDGTVVGTKILKSKIDAIINFTVSGDQLYFAARSPDTGTRELWVSDGTTSGTHLVKNINPTGSSYPSFFTPFHSKLIFKASPSSSNYSLWITDGTEIGTTQISEFHPASDLIPYGDSFITTVNDGVHGYEPWITDGTAAGTKILKDIIPGTSSSHPSKLITFNNKLYFSANDEIVGAELWVTDGTENGTQLLKDIKVGLPNPYPSHSYPSNLHIIKGKLYFTATDNNGNTLWMSDGTSDGTQQLKGISPINNNVTQLGNKLYFTANDGTHGNELWLSDGTAAGTVMLKDITENGDTAISNLSLVDGKIYFSVNDDLWVSDGTTNGTRLVKFKTGIMTDVVANPFENIILTQNDNDAVTITISLSDDSKGSLSATTIAAATLADAQSQLRNVVYTPINANSDYIVEANVIVNDGKADSQVYTHQIKVTAYANVNPVITIRSSLTALMNTAKDLTFSYTDEDGDTVVASLKLVPAHGVIAINGTTITYTPESDYFGNDAFTLTLTDNNGFSVDKTITVVIPANTPPAKPSISVSTIVKVDGQNVIGALQSSDADDDLVEFSIVSGNDNDYFSIDENNNLVVTNANTNLTEGSYTLVIKSSDGKSEQLSTIVFYVSEPLTFNYQGFLSKAGQAVSEELSMTFKLYDSVDAMEAKWSTTKTVTVQDGIYNVVIGLGEPTTLNSLAMLSKDYYMGISIASNNEMTPRQLFKPSGFVKILADKVNVLERQAK